VDYATSDGTATAGSDYTAAAGTLSFAAGVLSKTFTVPVTNDSLGEPSETVNLALSNAVGALIGPRATAVLTITDNEPVVQFSVAAYTVLETGPAATITVSRTGGTAAFTVDYASSNGTATAGSDYTAAAGTLSFAAAVLSKTFTVPIANDSLDEPNETVNLTLSNASGAAIGPRATAVLTITDNDTAGVLAFGTALLSVSEAGPAATITVTRTGGAASGVTVDYASSDGTAAAGSDYTAASGTLSFAAGESSKTFTVPVLEDATVEGSETVLLALSVPSGSAVLGAQSTSILVIVDNEVTLQFSASDYTVGEAGLTATITVVRSGSTTQTVGVTYATSAGTATAATDYTEKTGTLSFGPGVTTQTFTIPIAQDTLDEPNETVNLTLSVPTGGATLGTRSSAALTILDDDVAGTLQFSAAAYTVTEAGPVATVTVTRTGGSASGVTVDYATSDGTATAGSDYTAAAGTLIFAAGVMSKTFTVPITNDAIDEANETVLLALSNPAGGATLGALSTGTLTITDND
jgi:hypothetical protein